MSTSKQERRPAQEPGAAEAARPVDPSMLLRPTHAANAFEETVHRLLQTVRLGVMAPGEKLPAERELAVMLGVSRDTLREAIGALAEAGYLISRRGRYGGTFVADTFPGATPVVDADGELHARASVPPAEVDDTLRLRRALETGAARQAAEAPLEREQVLRLRQALRECDEAPLSDYRRLDARLHLLVAELSGSPSLVRLEAEVRMRVNELLDRIPLIAPNIEHSNAQHAALVGAIIDGDPEAAGRIMEEHVAGSEALLRGFLT